MKRLTLLTLTLVLTVLAQLTAPPVQAEVSIPDANLAAVIREALELPAGAAITADAMRNLTLLDAYDRGIADLTGLEYAVNLTTLSFGGAWHSNEFPHPISNLSPLASLTNLDTLILNATAVSDVSALANLTNLENLWLSSTAVSDVSSLASFTNLEELLLIGTAVSDVSALASLTNLERLELGGTAVSDVSALTGLTNLESLGLGSTAVSDVSALANLTNLERLELEYSAVSDVSALASLTNLERLELYNTDVSDVSSLASLTQLKTLDLRHTFVSDVSSLASLTQLKTLDLRGCPLNAAAHQTHIPAIQANGTEVEFSPFKPIHLQRVPWLVSLIYFRPSDRPVRPNVDAEIDGLIKEAQRFFADQLELHGFERKTFQFETDANGNAVVHHVNGKFPNAHYQQSSLPYPWAAEIREQIYIPSRHIIVRMLDSAPDGRSFTGAAGTGGGDSDGGSVNIDSWHWRVLAHELAHAFGLKHDWRADANAKRIKKFTDDPMLTSFCAAEWLSVHPAFNPGQPVSTSGTRVEMLPPILASPPNTIRLRFEVTDRDGLHQAQLRIRDFGHSRRYGALIDCQRLTGVHDTVEFVTTALTPEIEEVTLSVIDVRGHMSEQSFPIDVASLLAAEEVPQLVADVNGDGVVNIQDLVLVAGQFGKTGEHVADVNGDGVVNIQDLVLVAGAFEAGAAAPSVRSVSRARLTVSDVEGWLIEARAVSSIGQDRLILTPFSPQAHLLSGSGSGDPELQSGSASRPGGLSYGRGIAVLERLLASLMPKETVLLANYPNPFNPETWIPYQLSKPAEVTVTIYAANGAVVRMLDLGHRRAGSYESRGRAAYWDGRNAAGESVASGVYFYTLSAGDFSATRKMVIRK